MSDNIEKIKDAAMIIAGISYYTAATTYIISKLSASYSLNLM